MVIKICANTAMINLQNVKCVIKKKFPNIKIKSIVMNAIKNLLPEHVKDVTINFNNQIIKKNIVIIAN